MIDSRNNHTSSRSEPIQFDPSPGIAANGEHLLDPWDAAEYATEEFLSRDQVVAVMQGLQPPTWKRRGRTKCLDEYWFEVQQLLDDVRHRRLPMPCRPRELLHWATTRGFMLPEVFAKHVPDPNNVRSQPPVKPKLERGEQKPTVNVADSEQEWTPPPGKTTAAQESRMECQRTARRIWAKKPQVSITRMLMEREIVRFMRSYKYDTVYKWVSAVDPRDPACKPGPRRKK